MSLVVAAALLVCASTGSARSDPNCGPVYLVYAGPYSTSPASSFGHLFLVLQPDDDLPLLLWDVVSFNAETHGAGPLRFLFRGVTGGFLGSFRTVKFHQKVRDYEVLEDRDLWIIRLRTSYREREALDVVLAEVKGRWFPYTFFSRNCAYYLQQLLARTLSDLPEPQGTVSPVEVLELAIRVGLAEASYYRPAASKSLSSRVRELSEPVHAKLRRGDWRDLASDYEWLRGLSAEERVFIQEYFRLKTLHTDEPLDVEIQEGLALLRLLNAQQIGSPNKQLTGNSPGYPRAFPCFHSYGKLTISSCFPQRRVSRIRIRYRPAVHGLADSWIGHRKVNTLELLTVELSIAGNLLQPRLDELVLFRQRSLAPADWITTNSSWMLEAAIKRGGLFGSGILHSCIRAGIGRTKEHADVAFIYFLMTSTLLRSSDDRLALAPGIHTGALYLVSDTWRIGVQWDWYGNVVDWRSTYDEIDLWIHHDVGETWGMSVRYLTKNELNDFTFAVERYF